MLQFILSLVMLNAILKGIAAGAREVIAESDGEREDPKTRRHNRLSGTNQYGEIDDAD